MRGSEGVGDILRRRTSRYSIHCRSRHYIEASRLKVHQEQYPLLLPSSTSSNTIRSIGRVQGIGSRGMSFCYWRIRLSIDSANLGLLDLSADAGFVSMDRRRASNCEENNPRIVSVACRYKAQSAIPKPKILITRRLIRRRLRNMTYQQPADTIEGRG